jgi:hypothetical protein
MMNLKHSVRKLLGYLRKTESGNRRFSRYQVALNQCAKPADRQLANFHPRFPHFDNMCPIL